MSIRVSLIHNALFPIQKYGGTERVIWWLAKGLHELGHSVQLVCNPQSSCPFAEIISYADFAQGKSSLKSEIQHFFYSPPAEPKTPYVVTIEGNGQVGERFLPNTIFVSEDHARRHGAIAFVYNGLDPDDYIFNPEQATRSGLLFLAKASWSVKNVRGAIRIARLSNKHLNILGGSRWWLPQWRGVSWRGMLGGSEKSQWIAGAEALVFPVLWHEPFGIAVTEALVSGTPVLATPFGSLKELVPAQVGKLCSTYEDFIQQAANLSQFKPQDCRDWALSKFHYLKMTQSYLSLYDRVLNGHQLNPNPPVTQPSAQKVPFDFF